MTPSAPSTGGAAPGSSASSAGPSPPPTPTPTPSTPPTSPASLVPVQVFRDVGLLDDAFFVYYDDTDFCRRARDAGYRILFEPASIVEHRKGATLGGQASPFGCYYLTRNRPYLVRKHVGRGPRYWAFLAYFTATRMARMALWLKAGRRDLVSATLHGMRDAALGRMGPRRA